MPVETASGEFVLNGEAGYLRRTLDELQMPSVLFDREQAIASLMRLRELPQRAHHL